MPFRLEHLFIGAFWVAALASSVIAQMPFRPGEKVEVKRGRDWVSATVIKIDRSYGVQVRFSDLMDGMNGSYRFDRVRRPYEADAIYGGRVWRMAEGDHSTVAALLKVSKDDVTLRTEAMKEVTVKIEKLSTKDQNFLKRLNQQSQGLIEVQEKETRAVPFSNDGTVVVASDSSANVPLEADPIREALELAEGGTAFESANIWDRIGAIIPLGGTDQWLLASLESSKHDNPLPTRLMWVSIRKKRMSRMHLLPAQSQLKDYHEGSKMALMLEPGGSQTMLSVWKSLPSDSRPTPIISWNLSNGTRRTRDAGNWARFSSRKQVIARQSDMRITAYDLKDRKVLWVTDQARGNSSTPLLSPQRRYLFVPDADRVRVLDPESGNELTHYSLNNSALALAIADNGKDLLVVMSNKMVAIDITQPDSIREVDLGFLKPGASVTVKWLDGDVVCLSTTADEMLLFSIDRGIPLWRYQFDSSAVSGSLSDDRVRRVVDSHLLFAASVRERKPGHSTARGFGVGAVKLPGPKASGFVKYLKRDELVIFDGTEPVRIEIKAESGTPNIDESVIRANLIRQAQANGWTISDDATHALSAVIELGEPTPVRYQVPMNEQERLRERENVENRLRDQLRPPRAHDPVAGWNIRPNNFPSSSVGPSTDFDIPDSVVGSMIGNVITKTTSVRPTVSAITFLYGPEQIPVWGWGIVSTPPMLRFKSDEQALKFLHADRPADIRFFERINVPDTIVDPGFRDGLGLSRITPTGLEVQSSQ
ncbi:hypothetical protein Pla22_21060 [Rubripirellula amarantea]|uniref:Pyrrolo-quinoline quinone repeat domain-containing protein n=1 Tax=Rubripirellula amarantea TaxID=2527999 RepID=A0A5C5WW24_9BACT|nr:PQQ-binding-like beta-propeller repeat protein [Rubripirellula amarantea]TWT54459.1 hypothetical protein Pla22_21060 [Rubripirellula amarantea]